MRFFFDNCVARPIVDFLATLSALDDEPHSFEHLTENHEPSERDEEWAEKLNHREENWHVVTLDKGKRENVAWRALRHPTLLVYPKFANLRARPQAEWILVRWPAIIKWAEACAGNQGRWIMKKGGGYSKTR